MDDVAGWVEGKGFRFPFLERMRLHWRGGAQCKVTGRTTSYDFEWSQTSISLLITAGKLNYLGGRRISREGYVPSGSTMRVMGNWRLNAREDVPLAKPFLRTAYL